MEENEFEFTDDYFNNSENEDINSDFEDDIFNDEDETTEEKKENNYEFDDDNDFIDKEEENIFGDEYNVFERTGMYTEKNFKKQSQDPIERLKANINAISIDLINHYNNINDSDIDFMLNKIGNLKKPEFKNATAYILGYLAIKNSGNKLNKNNIFKVFEKCLPYVQDKSVKKADIIRYARLWLNILN